MRKANSRREPHSEEGQYHVTLVSGSFLLAPVNQTLRNLFSGATCTVLRLASYWERALEFVRNNSSSLALIDVATIPVQHEKSLWEPLR